MHNDFNFSFVIVSIPVSFPWEFFELGIRPEIEFVFLARISRQKFPLRFCDSSEDEAGKSGISFLLGLKEFSIEFSSSKIFEV